MPVWSYREIPTSARWLGHWSAPQKDRSFKNPKSPNSWTRCGSESLGSVAQRTESYSSSSTCGSAEVVAFFNSEPSSVMVAPRAVAKELAASLS